MPLGLKIAVTDAVMAQSGDSVPCCQHNRQIRSLCLLVFSVTLIRHPIRTCPQESCFTALCIHILVMPYNITAGSQVHILISHPAIHRADATARFSSRCILQWLDIEISIQILSYLNSGFSAVHINILKLFHF